MLIYEVHNKVYSQLFESKKDAERYLSHIGTTASGLEIHSRYVVDASEQSVQADAETESCEHSYQDVPVCVHCGHML